MYFNRKNSQQKNWRMIKKGKHFLFGCALVFAIGATANVASADTIVTDVTTVDQVQDSTAASEDADSEAAASTTEESEVASSTTATSEAASETVSTSTVTSSEASETTSTASEVAVSESSEASTVASSEASETSTSSETATSTSVETVSEVSTTVSASETAAANRTAFIGYEVQYTTSSGEVVGKTANIVAADTTEAVATATLTVAATDVPAGYELAAEQAYSLTQQISENQVNILSFAVVKKSEEEEIAESQLANKTVLEQVLSEATLLSEEALRLVATTQAGNTTLEAAATATQETADKATLVFEDAAATQEQVDSQVEAVKASNLALAEEMLKVDEDGVLTVALNTTGTTIESATSETAKSNVTSSYEIRDGYVYWTHTFNNNFVNKNYYNYYFTLPKSVGDMENVVITQYNTDGTVRNTTNGWAADTGTAGAITQNIGSIGTGYFDTKKLSEGSASAITYANQNHVLASIDRSGFTGSDTILSNSQENYYVINSNRRTNYTTNWSVTFRTPIVNESGTLDFIAGGTPLIKSDGDTSATGTYGALLKEDLDIQNDYKLAWTQPSVTGRNDKGFTWSEDGKSIIYYYDADDTTSFNANEILKLLVANPVDSSNRTLNGDEKEKLETGIVNSTADNYYGTGDSTGADGFYYKDYLAYENGNLIQYLDVVNPTHLGGGETIPLDVDKTNTTDSITIDAKNGAGEITITSDDIPSGKQLVNSVTQRQVYARTRIVALDSTINSATDTNVVNLYFVPYTAAPNQAPTVTVNSTPTNVQINDGAVPNAIFIFGLNQGSTEDIDGKTSTSPVADPKKATRKVAEFADADGTIASIVYNDLKNDKFDLASSTDPSATDPKYAELGEKDALLVNTDGYLTGYLIYGPGAKSSRMLKVTDNGGATTNSDSFMVLGYTDKVADTTAIAKEEGVNVTADEIYSKLAIDVNSSYPNAVPSTLEVPTDQYTREIVGYRTVSTSGTTVTKGATTAATASTLPTSGTYEVRVKTTNIYGQEIYNWVTVKYTDTTAPEAPSVVANENGSVTVTPSQTTGDDTKTTDITYTDETGTSQTVTVTKADDGTWSVPADSGVTVDATTGAVTIPANKVQDGSTVSATSTDEAGNTSNPATDTAKNNPDTTAPATPTVVANEDGSVTVTPSTTAGDDTKTVDITYTDENGTTQTVTVTKADDGTWSVPADSGVTVDATTGAVTIPADKVQDGSTVSATSTDEASNTSNPATDTAKNNPDTTAPESPTVVANEDGSVTVTPSQTAGDDTKTVDITYTDENGTEKTVTVTKGDDGTWTVPTDSGVTVDATTGAVTIPADKVQDGSTVSATSTDEAGNTSNPATDTAKNDPDTTAPTAPVVNTPTAGDTTVTGTTEPGATVKVTFPDGTEVTTTADENGNYTVDVPAGVELKEGDKVTATATDKAGNESPAGEGTTVATPDTTAPEAPV
ncbi:TPA: Ig-like domain-containing protein, partial [Streptococcus suis]